MDKAVERLHEAAEELRRSLVGLDGHAQLRQLNGSTAAVARLRVELEGMRADALDLLVKDLEGETTETPADNISSRTMQPADRTARRSRH
jgi:hypothetical protein